jgi:hypothetical protein
MSIGIGLGMRLSVSCVEEYSEPAAPLLDLHAVDQSDARDDEWRDTPDASSPIKLINASLLVW